MRILINDFCGHPFQAQLSRELARSSHSVLHTYFAGNNTPKGDLTKASGEAANCRIEPISIGREFRKHSVWSRRSADLAYGRAVAASMKEFRPDVVVSSNMPLDGQKILLRATHDAGARFVFWLQDVLSVAVEFVLRRKRLPLAGLAGRYYRRLERRLLQQSDAVVCIAPEFRATLENWQIDREKTFVIENWAPLEEVYPLPRSNAWSREHALEGKFCFMYSGTLGMKHKPELLLDLARRFESRPDVVTVVIADGAGADWLLRNQHRVRPGALRMLPFQPYERLPEVLATADVLITLLDEECGTFAVPSKTLAYLCAGRPLLLAAPAENPASRIVCRAEAGEAVSAASSDFLAAAVRLLESPLNRQRFASQARAYAERTFDIHRIQDQFLAIFDFAQRTAAMDTATVSETVPVGSAD